jgi:hypothetical protein
MTQEDKILARGRIPLATAKLRFNFIKTIIIINIIIIIIMNSERLGLVPVPQHSRWIWSFHLFLWRPTSFRPFRVSFSACLGIWFVSIL